mmetsp:Transcript_1085/g.3709  ORF Transcript_1085/g.3709 Transcript_1085/m.3709 type:complete len:195 (-) Transcript_1085:310-894(-)
MFSALLSPLLSCLGLKTIFAPFSILFAFTHNIFQAKEAASAPPPTGRMEVIKSTSSTVTTILLFYSQLSILFASVPFVPYISVPILCYFLFPSTRPYFVRAWSLFMIACIHLWRAMIWSGKMLWIVVVMLVPLWYGFVKSSTMMVVRLVLGALGFTYRGVVEGSVAAFIQSKLYGSRVGRGSLFSRAQSFARRS